MTQHVHLFRLIVRLLAGVAAVAAVGLGVTDLARADDARPTAPARERPVIVEVSGDADNGFALTYDDGARLYPPTDSEALAECSEYVVRVARVRCRARFRTWYRDLGDLQRSLAHVRAEG